MRFFTFKQSALKLAIASVFALGGISSAYAANEIYIGKSGATTNNIDTLTINQSGAAAVNRIGTSSGTPFYVEGKWSNIRIFQTNEIALGSDTAAVVVAGTPGMIDDDGEGARVNYVPARDTRGDDGNVITGFIRNASTGVLNTAILTQEGDGNRIVLAVGASVKSTGTVVVGISQIGDRNSSTYTMNHLGNITVAETTAGNNNIVSVTSSAGTNYSNEINLTGDGNKVTVVRAGIFDTTTDIITLIGALNTVTLNGTATGINTATLHATGSNNVFGITQDGANSMANIVVATSYKNVIVNQQTPGSQFSLTGTLTNGGTVNITQ